MLTMALAMEPKILVAAEPTANLDVTIQVEILARLRRLQKERGMTILYITHDLGVVARIADEVAVIHGGTIMEHTSSSNLFNKPTNPYAYALLQSLPRIDVKQQVLTAIPGSSPDMLDLPEECPFLPHCSKVLTTCRPSFKPSLVEVSPQHMVTCYNPMDPGGELGR